MEIALLADMVKELILDNEEVALPGLGTFVTEVVPASFSDRGYTINPPYRRLSFRERQGSDDKLAQLYSKANGMDLETSRKIISGFVAGVKDELTKKKAVVFPGLGRLRATKENAFFFIPDEDLEIFPYGFGLQPVSLKTHEETPEEVYDAVEKLSAIVDVPEPEVKVPEPIVESVPEQEEMPIELVSPAPAAPETPAPPEETEKTAPAAPASNTAPETQKVRKKDGRRITRIAAACVVGTALLLLVIFIILSRTAPSFTDSLLYTPEELEIINYQDTEK
ncbi:MAG: hypothetical protein LKK12_06875 [Bacteroidales bacterium]|nr:hypothetical protein [Bacteroidales bacterium]MCI2134084.1 hypothetical protein [Bacteroidales bacterium]